MNQRLSLQLRPSETAPVFVGLANEMEAHRASRKIARAKRRDRASGLAKELPPNDLRKPVHRFLGIRPERSTFRECTRRSP